MFDFGDFVKGEKSGWCLNFCRKEMWGNFPYIEDVLKINLLLHANNREKNLKFVLKEKILCISI